MNHKLLLLALVLLISAAAFNQSSSGTGSMPEYNDKGQLRLPELYREWTYLSTGLDMSYTPGGNMDHHMFDNVFVNPESYKKFKETGTWPDKTMLVLEVRGAESRASINQRGNFQSGEVMGVEVHVKDEAKFAGKWAFFAFDNGNLGNLFPAGAACYSCHQAHAAVDTTFVQFYPTLLPLARNKGTLSAAYLKENSEEKKPAQ
jgi:Cytochrome P460